MPWLVPNPSSPSASMQALIKTSHARRSTKTTGSFLPLLENRVAHVSFMTVEKKKEGCDTLRSTFKYLSVIVQFFSGQSPTWTHRLFSAHMLLRIGLNWMCQRDLIQPHFLKLPQSFHDIAWHCLRFLEPRGSVTDCSSYLTICCLLPCTTN